MYFVFTVLNFFTDVSNTLSLHFKNDIDFNKSIFQCANIWKLKKLRKVKKTQFRLSFFYPCRGSYCSEHQDPKV